MTAARVAVVGGGISGIACARALLGSRVDVTVLDRGHRLGGRMATRTMRGTGLPYDGRVVDVGAAFLTAQDPGFLEVVEGWSARGLLRPWTDTLEVVDVEGTRSTTTGPLRYAAPAGLRSLVEDLAADLPVVVGPREVAEVARDGEGWSVDGDTVDAVVLAMPGPQALDLLPEAHPARARLEEPWGPVLALVAAYDDACWPRFDAMFVNGWPDLAFVADDGRRRGDGAPVLVAHSTGELAAAHLDDPSGATPTLVDALTRAVGASAPPRWTEVRRWSLARPLEAALDPFFLDAGLGLCGDAWGRTPRVETAWLSGDSLGRQLAAALRA